MIVIVKLKVDVEVKLPDIYCKYICSENLYT